MDSDWLRELPIDLQEDVITNLEQHVKVYPPKSYVESRVLNTLSQLDRAEAFSTSLLPPGWSEERWLLTPYYVNSNIKIKTWIRPGSEGFPDFFPRVGSHVTTFNPSTPPPLPQEFQVAASEASECESQMVVNLVISPVGSIRSIWMYGAALLGKMELSVRWCGGLIHSIVSNDERVALILVFVLVWTFGACAACFVLLLPNFLQFLTKFGLAPILFELWRVRAERFVRNIIDPMPTIREISAGILAFATLRQIGKDQASWSHWKVLVGCSPNIHFSFTH